MSGILVKQNDLQVFRTQPKPSFFLQDFILLTECLEQAKPVNTDNKTELLLNMEDMTMQYFLG